MATITLPAVDEIRELTQDQILSIKLAKDRRPYKDGTSRAGQFFYLGTYMGVGFTIEEGDFAAFNDGNIAKLTLQFTEYQRASVADPAKMEARNGWRIMELVTWDQLIGSEGKKMKLDVLRKGNEVQLKKMDLELQQNVVDEELMTKLFAAAGAAGAAAAKETVGA